jgi:hypothetical protein
MLAGSFIQPGYSRLGLGSLAHETRLKGKNSMLDTVLIAIGVGFFVASILYVLACERM